MNNPSRRITLVKYRKERGWLQKDVVEKLSIDYNVFISESYYGMIEQGVRTPSLHVALAISALFNVEPTKFFLSNNTTFCCIQ
ncbi:helix-turn-helix transcriptional regulator [Rummeliibacillus sp. JY-2-4R]